MSKARGIMFHHFHDDPEQSGVLRHLPGQGSITAQELATMIEWLGVERFLSPAAWRHKQNNNDLADHDLCLTFDDGLKCQFDIARPVLDRYGLTAFWFVYSGIFDGSWPLLELYRDFRGRCYPDIGNFYDAFENQVMKMPGGDAIKTQLHRFDPASYLVAFPFYSDADRRFRFLRDDILGPSEYARVMNELMQVAGYDTARQAGQLWMTGDDVAVLVDQGHETGLHSHSHPTRLTALSPDEIQQEYEVNKTWLETITQQPVHSVSHPCGQFSPASLAVLEGLDISTGFSSNMNDHQPPLAWRREDHANILAGMTSGKSGLEASFAGGQG